MNAVQHIAARCGVDFYTWLHLVRLEDLNRIKEPWEYVQLLGGLGVPLSELEAPVIQLAGLSPTIAERILPELRPERWPQSTISVRNAVGMLCDYVPEDVLLEAYRTQFADRVFSLAAELLERPAELPQITEQEAVYLGRIERVR